MAESNSVKDCQLILDLLNNVTLLWVPGHFQGIEIIEIID